MKRFLQFCEENFVVVMMLVFVLIAVPAAVGLWHLMTGLGL